jgi:hypothetical protein
VGSSLKSTAPFLTVSPAFTRASVMRALPCIWLDTVMFVASMVPEPPSVPFATLALLWLVQMAYAAAAITTSTSIGRILFITRLLVFSRTGLSCFSRLRSR